MSVTFNGKSGEVDGDGWNLMDTDNRSKYRCRPQISVCWIGAAVVCLVLLLTMIMVAQNTSAISHWDTKFEKLIYEISKSRDDLRDERDQLKIQCSNLTKEMESLQSQYNTLAASRDKLQEDIDMLTHNRTDKPCNHGWIKFNNKCYYVSPNGVTKTWENSRKDCREKGADLVIITTKEEQDFVSGRNGVSWIGLHRGESEDEWKWVDGTGLVDHGFWQKDEPNNSDGEEDCVEVSSAAMAWNDVPCKRKFSWVCED
ncbi:CD209 antigen Dendritic cell-specific ICAM-3-grabbing non-integrin 1 [Larimichthys crocea]|uniref:CD209 antigen Dendritic cell-specific ICAM-3-grabbing non-integrin 1 n=1 Tax=Larimichthys crocea TaxID=215358 RepID=A0A6G0IBA4_LARCR|nr:CD209 antigen Dendritic cell-specific ICAM-3-grabbing non-integrin 1 [Larimichthys crocea]